MPGLWLWRGLAWALSGAYVARELTTEPPARADGIPDNGVALNFSPLGLVAVGAGVVGAAYLLRGAK